MGLCGGEGSEEREREWEEAAEAVAYDSCTWPPPVVAVCGPGNSGKSAFSRLLLNTLIGRLNQQRRICKIVPPISVLKKPNCIFPVAFCFA
jgi:polynucleotide 5'-kinase involved in rRNA processing